MLESMYRNNSASVLMSVLLAVALVLSGCVSAPEVTETSEPETTATSASETEESSSSDDTSETTAVKDGLKDIGVVSENKYTCKYDGVKHDFIVYLPEEPEGAPLVLLLHGYGESAETFRLKTHFLEQGCDRGYAVVYVDGSSNIGGSAAGKGWNSGISISGNDDVGFLKDLAKYLQDEYKLSHEKTYVAGFSNGAFMTHRIAMEAQDVFAVAVSVAGKMPKTVWEARNESNDVSFFQITGEKDEVVPKYSDKSADSAIDPAIEDVVGYWASSNGLTASKEEEIGKGSALTRYSEEGKISNVWNLSIKGGYHSWPEDNINGFKVNDLILDFFDEAG